MATAVFDIQSQDGWVEVTSAGVDFIRIQQYPYNYPLFITTGSTTPPIEATFANVFIDFQTSSSNGETLTIGSEVYKFVTTATQPFDVAVGATPQETVANLIAVVNAVSTVVIAAQATQTDVIRITAKTSGSSGNTIAVSSTDATVIPSSSTLSGGADADVGYRLDCDDFWCNVPVSEKYFVRTANPSPDQPLRVYVFYVET